MRKVGFGKEVDLIEKGFCPFCHKKVSLDDFRDDLSIKEWRTSGLCQKCQDGTFGKG